MSCLAPTSNNGTNDAHNLHARCTHDEPLKAMMIQPFFAQTATWFALFTANLSHFAIACAGLCVTNVIAAPEGARGQMGGADHRQAPDEADSPADVSEFTQQDYDKFMKGYKSQYEEISMWVDPKDIEGEVASLAGRAILCSTPANADTVWLSMQCCLV